MAAQLTDAAHPLLYEINPSLDVLDGDSRLLNVLKSQRPHGGRPHPRSWKDLRFQDIDVDRTHPERQQRTTGDDLVDGLLVCSRPEDGLCPA